MHSEGVLHWLTSVSSNTPLPPGDSEPVVWPPPQTRAYRLQVQREVEQKRQNPPPAVVKPDREPLSHLNQTAKTAPRRRSPRKNAVPDPTPDDGLLQFSEVRAVIDEVGHGKEPQQDRNNGDSRNQRFDQSGQEINEEDPSINPRQAPPSTNLAFQSRVSLSQYILPILHSEDGSETCSSRSTTASRTFRARSPIKRSHHDLEMLEKKVMWLDISMGELRRKMQHHKSEDLYDKVTRALDGGYLPMELRNVLDTKLGLKEQHITLYAKRPVRPMAEPELKAAQFLRDANAQIDGLLPEFFHFESLLLELKALRTIVARTRDHKKLNLAEPSWNESVHRPMLDLAVLHNPTVGIENITGASIKREFLPKPASRLSVTPDTGLISYAMVLNPQVEERLEFERVVNFINLLDFPGFNQSSYYPLRLMPSGVFIETKASVHRSSEAKFRLGMWLASWYNRVSEFPCSENNYILPPPVIPILLVEAASWELYFAFDTGSQYEVCGPVDGSMGTKTLHDAYRLLAVLRTLAHWMATDFLEWVDDCLKQAEL
ncbi:hypothetical protein O1611_g9345 [Lasiodiplodia mahajangana]|uniref:Uncharacterized protein n=1 Tax=Lasiodiplodia mahajangana TaxID=1108764 RepID=A0ACC2J9W4_9PEZI|nr:hypothetical protein O1611_g9345 [Lasiodiplodia mahajangana]